MSKENIENKINELDELWHQLKEVSETRSKSLEETLECSESFWLDFNSLLDLINDLDPDSVIEQQQQHQYHEQIVRELDDNEFNVLGFKETGNRLIELCGQYDQPEVEKSIEELDAAWSRIKQLVSDRETELQQTFDKSSSKSSNGLACSKRNSSIWTRVSLVTTRKRFAFK